MRTLCELEAAGEPKIEFQCGWFLLHMLLFGVHRLSISHCLSFTAPFSPSFSTLLLLVFAFTTSFGTPKCYFGMGSATEMPHPGSPKVAIASDAITFKTAVDVIEDSENEPSTPKFGQPQKEVATVAVGDRGNVDSPRTPKHVNATKGAIDTSTPFHSVKAALSKFDGSIDWKARHRTQSMERRKLLEILGKAEETPDQKKQSKAVESDLDKTTKLLVELKDNLERAQREESQVKQQSESARLKVEQMEQEIANEASLLAKAQLEVDEVWLRESESRLESMNEELEALHAEYASLVTERDLAVRKAEEDAAASEEVEQSVEDDLKSLNQQASSVKDLKSKLDAASYLLLKLKADFPAYMESNLKQEGDEERRKALEEVKLNTEKATAEVNCLKEAAMSLKAELEHEKSILTTIRQRKGMAPNAVASVEAEPDKARSEIALVQMEKETTEKMIELPEKLQQAAQEAEQAKSFAQAANIELSKAKEEAEQAKAGASTIETRLLAAQKEADAAMVSEKLATEGTKALQGNELATNNNDSDSSSMVTLLMDEYLKLSKQAQEAEEHANIRIAAANSQIEAAKESELRSLEKLEDLEKELAARQESLKVATEKAEKAKEGKLGVEQELRKWRDEQKQQRKAEELNQVMVSQNKSFDKTRASAIPGDGLTKEMAKSSSLTSQTGATQEAKTKKKKKKSFFRGIAMFLAKRKTHPSK
ncbi:hypothetical protein L6164_020402 [Bauhinia variegata]|uniref:Uncharacterized protein n=1 Tax=Bauhinia variegata TaxID=167791 RepID=A0ACB9MV06_BAUVA|nr:hypothetical protein L6164_020402 [Bauhinia variegata]